MVLRLRPQILKDALLPESLHEVPVLHDAVPDGVLGCIARPVCLVSYVEVWNESVCVCVCGGGGGGGGGGDNVL